MYVLRWCPLFTFLCRPTWCGTVLENHPNSSVQRLQFGSSAFRSSNFASTPSWALSQNASGDYFKQTKQYTHRDSDGGVVHMPEFWHASTACWCPNSCSVRIQPSYLTFVFRKKGKAKVACEILQRTQPEFGHCSCLYISYARQLLFFFF